MKRGDALKTMGALAGATAGTRLLGACGDNGLPPGIEHIVVVMMETRSYDPLLGARALEGLGGDGLTPAMQNAGRDGTLYVLRSGIQIVNEQGETTRHIPLEGFGWALITLMADGRHALVASFFTGEVAKMDLATGTKVGSIQTGVAKAVAGVAEYPG